MTWLLVLVFAWMIAETWRNVHWSVALALGGYGLSLLSTLREGDSLYILCAQHSALAVVAIWCLAYSVKALWLQLPLMLMALVTVTNPSMRASMLTVMLPWLGYLDLSPMGGKLHTRLKLAYAVLLVGVVLTSQASVPLGLLVLTLLWSLARALKVSAKLHPSTIPIILGTLAGALLAALKTQPLHVWLSSSGRFALWGEAFAHWPVTLFGTGPGSAALWLPRLSLDQNSLFGSMHNDYLQMLFELGPVATALILLGAMFTWQKSRENSQLCQTFTLYLAWMVFNFPLHSEACALFGALIVSEIWMPKESSSILDMLNQAQSLTDEIRKDISQLKKESA